MGSFCEVKLYQVKPNKVEAFEDLMHTIANDMRSQVGCIGMKVMKRFYVIDDVDKPPRPLTRIVKCVKYYSYWEFDTMENYTKANAWFFEFHAKATQRFLIMPFDISCGETLC